MLIAQLFLMFLAALVLSVALTPWVIRLAHHWDAIDHPGERKVHKEPIPRLGGVAVFFAFALVSLAALLFRSHLRERLFEEWHFWVALAAGTTLVFLLGVWDDLHGSPVWLKFLVQTIAAGILIWGGGIRIQVLSNPFGGKIELGWIAIPLTVLWVVGVTNAFNLIDGLDGLAGGIAFISVSTIFAISLSLGNRAVVVLISAALAGALLGFLKFNFHPARIFLGDCGSMFLGYMLAVLSMIGSNKRTAALALLVPILIVGIPVFDTLNAMMRRLARHVLKEKTWRPSALLAMFRADRAHIHHMLVDRGYSHRTSVLILYALALLLGLTAFIAVLVDNDRVSFALMLAGFAGFILVRHYGHYLPLGTGQGSEQDSEDDAPG